MDSSFGRQPAHPARIRRSSADCRKTGSCTERFAFVPGGFDQRWLRQRIGHEHRLYLGALRVLHRPRGHERERGLRGWHARRSVSHDLFSCVARWLGTVRGNDRAPLRAFRPEPAQRRTASPGSGHGRLVFSRRCAGTEIWQRASDDSVSGPGQRISSVWFRSSACLAQHSSGIFLRNVAARRAD